MPRKVLFWAGLVILVLGILSLFVPLPRKETRGIRAGDVSIGIQTQTQEKVSPVISGILIAGGVLMMLGGGWSGHRTSLF